MRKRNAGERVHKGERMKTSRLCPLEGKQLATAVCGYTNVVIQSVIVNWALQKGRMRVLFPARCIAFGKYEVMFLFHSFALILTKHQSKLLSIKTDILSLQKMRWRLSTVQTLKEMRKPDKNHKTWEMEVHQSKVAAPHAYM